LLYGITSLPLSILLFFLTDTATTYIYTLSLHDALPISHKYLFPQIDPSSFLCWQTQDGKLEGISSESSESYTAVPSNKSIVQLRSEEHTSELQSRGHLVCRLLLEKKK